MKHISKDAYINNSSGLVLSLANEAKEKKAEGIKVLDASIGMLLDDKGTLVTYPLVDKTLKETINQDVRKYTMVHGNKKFQENVINWVLKNNLEIKKKYCVAASATMGGTGALFLVIRNYVNNNGSLLIPDIGWSNYDAITNQLNRKVVNYRLLLNNSLNINDIEKQINLIAKKEKRVTILINDPCHNPTGYSMNKNEWLELIKFFNKINEKTPLTLILDFAYADYSLNSRLYFDLINKVKAKYLTLVAFSASKTLSMYGMRFGALLAIGNKEDIEDYKLASSSTIRTTWSSPNAHLIETFNSIFSSNKNYSSFEKYKNKYIQLLKERYLKGKKIFDKLLPGAKLLPYKEGFFLCYKVNNANKVAESLKKKNIYVLPIKNTYIRVAVCSLINL